MTKEYLITGCAALLICGLISCTWEKGSSLPEPVSGFELSRYMGKWYEIARLPNPFENGMSSVSAEYSLHSNGEVRVVNRGLKKGKLKEIFGTARFKGDSDKGLLEVSFFQPFYGEYRIIKLADDYSFSVVCSGKRKYLWILARTPSLPDDTLAQLLVFIQRSGFDPQNLIFRD